MDQTMEIDLTDPILALQLPPRKRKATEHYTDAIEVKRRRGLMTSKSKRTQSTTIRSQKKVKGMNPVKIKSDTRKKTNKLYSCGFCEKNFKSLSYLKLHLAIHYGIKAFTCQFCGASFRQQIHLQTHLLRHYGRWDYQCWNCFKRFRQPSNLNTHIGRCKGSKNSIKNSNKTNKFSKKYSSRSRVQISAIMKQNDAALGKRSKSLSSSASGSLSSPPSSPLLYNSFQTQSFDSSPWFSKFNNINVKVFDEVDNNMEFDDNILQSISMSCEEDEATSSNSSHHSISSNSSNSFVVHDVDMQPYPHMTEQKLEFVEPMIFDDDAASITLSLREELERCYLIQRLYEDLNQCGVDPISISIQDLMKSYSSSVQNSTTQFSSPCCSNSLSDLDMDLDEKYSNNNSDNGASVSLNVHDMILDSVHSCIVAGLKENDDTDMNCANETVMSNSFSFSSLANFNYYYSI